MEKKMIAEGNDCIQVSVRHQLDQEESKKKPTTSEQHIGNRPDLNARLGQRRLNQRYGRSSFGILVDSRVAASPGSGTGSPKPSGSRPGIGKGDIDGRLVRRRRDRPSIFADLQRGRRR